MACWSARIGVPSIMAALAAQVSFLVRCTRFLLAMGLATIETSKRFIPNIVFHTNLLDATRGGIVPARQFGSWFLEPSSSGVTLISDQATKFG